MCLACDIGLKWKAVGRGLGLEEPDLDEIEADEDQLYERCYAVLKKWTEVNGSAANYETLSAAFVHPGVQLDQLAWKYCGLTRPESPDGAKAVESCSPSTPYSSIQSSAPEVFLSYQWDIQSTALEIAAMLKENGIQCWVDVGQMGGGDSLYAEMDSGIRAAKVFLCCVTARYCKSENCQREATLADSVKKPIIPLLLELIPWPPEGQLGPIFAKLLYVDMTQGYQSKLDELKIKINAHIAKSEH